jgi:FkbM family methyltransferase
LPVERLTLRDLDFDLTYLVSNKRPIIFDVGANKGQSIERFRRTWRSGKIIAFEANPGLALDLELKWACPNITVKPVAVGSSAGCVEFSIFENDELSSCLNLSSAESNPFALTVLKARIDVPVITLDAYAQEEGFKEIDLLKIDTQGFDLKVLRGASELLRRSSVDAILVEVNFIEIYENECSFGEIERFLAEMSYGLIGLYEVVRRHGCIGWATACFRRNR